MVEGTFTTGVVGVRMLARGDAPAARIPFEAGARTERGLPGILRIQGQGGRECARD